MKITRSALKNLIKEEMRRINEDDPTDPASPTTMTGDGTTPAYMFDGIDTEAIKVWFADVQRNSLKYARWNDKAVEIEGHGDAQHRAWQYQHYVDGDPDGQARSVEADEQRWAPGVVFWLKWRATQHTDGEGYVTAEVDRGAPAEREWLEKNVTGPFNTQNGGKGGKMSQGGTSMLKDNFSWSWKYHS